MNIVQKFKLGLQKSSSYLTSHIIDSLKSKKIDECIDKLIEDDLWEVFTVDQDGIEDAAIHVMREKCVHQKALSVYKGVVFTDYIDVHTIDDIVRIRRVINES